MCPLCLRSTQPHGTQECYMMFCVAIDRHYDGNGVLLPSSRQYLFCPSPGCNYTEAQLPMVRPLRRPK